MSGTRTTDADAGGEPVVGWVGARTIDNGDRVRLTWIDAEGESVVRTAEVAHTRQTDDTLQFLLAPPKWARPRLRVVVDRDGTIAVERRRAGDPGSWREVNDGAVTFHRIGE